MLQLEVFCVRQNSQHLNFYYLECAGCSFFNSLISVLSQYKKRGIVSIHKSFDFKVIVCSKRHIEIFAAIVVLDSTKVKTCEKVLKSKTHIPYLNPNNIWVPTVNLLLCYYSILLYIRHIVSLIKTINISSKKYLLHELERIKTYICLMFFQTLFTYYPIIGNPKIPQTHSFNESTTVANPQQTQCPIYFISYTKAH